MKTPREVLLSRHRHVEPKLDEMRSSIAARPAVAPYQRLPVGLDRRASRVVFILWRELIWPCWRVWAGLACAWALIIALNLAAYEPATRVAGKTAPLSREELRALSEQRLLLAELIEPMPETAETPQSKPPGPRSERRPKFVNA